MLCFMNKLSEEVSLKINHRDSFNLSTLIIILSHSWIMHFRESNPFPHLDQQNMEDKQVLLIAGHLSMKQLGILFL